MLVLVLREIYVVVSRGVYFCCIILNNDSSLAIDLGLFI